ELDDGFRLYLEGEQGLFVFEDVTIGSSNFERVFVEGTRLEIAEGWLDAPRFAERSDADCLVAIHDRPGCEEGECPARAAVERIVIDALDSVPTRVYAEADNGEEIELDARELGELGMSAGALRSPSIVCVEAREDGETGGPQDASPHGGDGGTVGERQGSLGAQPWDGSGAMTAI